MFDQHEGVQQSKVSSDDNTEIAGNDGKSQSCHNICGLFRTFTNISPRIVINPGPIRTYVDDGPKSFRAGTITCPEISTIRCLASLSN